MMFNMKTVRNIGIRERSLARRLCALTCDEDISQKKELFITTAVRISNPTHVTLDTIME
jgi:hypothetical protein